MKILDLFSGIGGFSLGLECTGGFQTIAFCEVETYCRKVLHKHWPEVPVFMDIRTLHKRMLDQHELYPEILTGGFPCQDLSVAGKGAGLKGERSGLWFEYLRLITEIKPRYAIIENVAVLRSRGLDQVLRNLTEIGYDAEWYCIPACAVGAPHRRDRIWLVAYPQSTKQQWQRPESSRQQNRSSDCCETVAHTNHPRLERWLREIMQERTSERIAGTCGASESDWPNNWFSEPNVGRVADGIPSRVDRLKALGNAIVPQIANLLGEAILRHEAT